MVLKMKRNDLIEKMERMSSTVLVCADSLPESKMLNPDQDKLVEELQYILFDAHKLIEEKIAEYIFRTVNGE
jgi:hypothetical protein